MEQSSTVKRSEFHSTMQIQSNNDTPYPIEYNNTNDGNLNTIPSNNERLSTTHSKEVFSSEYIVELIHKLESKQIEASSQLNREIMARLALEEKTSRSAKSMGDIIQKIKNDISVYDLRIDQKMAKVQNDISNDVISKNNALMKYVDGKVKRKVYDDDEVLFSMARGNAAFASSSSPLFTTGGALGGAGTTCIGNSKTGKFLEGEFTQYRTELSNVLQRLNVLELSFEKKIEEINEKINTCENGINVLKENINDVCSKINFNNKITSELSQNLNKEQQIKNQNTRAIEMLIKDVTMLKQNVNGLLQSTKSFENLNKEMLNKIQNQIDNNYSDLSEKMRSLKESLINQLNSQSNEIDKFESHLLNEFTQFTTIVKGAVDEGMTKNKSAYDYTTSDVELLRNKNEYLELALNKLRTDVYDSIKQTETFMMNKIDNSNKERLACCLCTCPCTCTCCCCENKIIKSN